MVQPMVCFPGATAHPRPSPPLCFHLQITHLIVLLYTNDQLVAKAATYTTHNNCDRQISMPSVESEPAIPA